MEPVIVGVRFQQAGKIYHFDAAAIPDIKIGDRIIVDTARGKQLGEVTQLVGDSSKPPEGTWKPIERLATPRDLILRKTWQQKEAQVIIECRKRAAELKLTPIKIVAAEFSFDGARLTIIFSSESEEKVDLKSLRHDIHKLYPQSQVELRQVGPRDVAKAMSGMGACGLEKRCCAKFITEFCPISIKMAKEQGVSLTPAEITGICGRLRCCIQYEHEQYAEARKELPKKNKRVVTPLGEGKVVEVAPLRMAVTVDLPDIGEREFTRDQLEPWDESETLRRKPSPPQSKKARRGKKN